MRAPIFRSPGAFAAIALGLGVLGKVIANSKFSVGWTMVAILRALPLISLGIVSDYLPGDWDRESRGLAFFSSKRNRLELLALLALPGLGFGIDMAGSFPLMLAALGVGVIGIGATVQLARVERTGAWSGHDL